MNFKSLSSTERDQLTKALKANVEGKFLRFDPRDTSFTGTADEVSDEEVIYAIRSVPCHYMCRCSAGISRQGFRQGRPSPETRKRLESLLVDHFQPGGDGGLVVPHN
jgi:hypothetical protein